MSMRGVLHHVSLICCCWLVIMSSMPGGDADAAKILVISSPLGMSHHIHMGKIADILARGDRNQVVYLRNSVFGSSKAGMKAQRAGRESGRSNPRLVVIEDPGSERYVEEVMSERGPVDPVFGKWNQSLNVNFVGDLVTMVNRTCHEILRRVDVWERLREEKFDVVIVNEFSSACIMAYLPRYLPSSPLIFYSTTKLNAVSSYLLNVPAPMSYVKFLVNPTGLQHTSEPTIVNRAKNFINYMVEFVFMGAIYRTGISVAREHLGTEEERVYQTVGEASLVLVQSDLAFDAPRPTLPNVVMIGGVLCADSKPLPKDLESFMSSAGDAGVIYVAFGTTVSSSIMGRGIMDLLMDTFLMLPEHKVLWKLEIVPDWRKVPDNVKIVKWAPQQDVLGHSQTKMFISHGGLNSVYESIYHAIPPLVLPVFGDQEVNAADLAATGMAITLDKNNLHKEDLVSAIRTLISDPRYRSSARLRSSILREHPESAVDRLHYWVDYVSRHQGAPHLRVDTRGLSLPQYWNLDLLLVGLLLLVLLPLYGAYRLVRRCCCRGRQVAPPAGSRKVKVN